MKNNNVYALMFAYILRAADNVTSLRNVGNLFLYNSRFFNMEVVQLYVNRFEVVYVEGV